VAQAYTILLDEGRYLCSPATMHRLLRERGTAGDRRAHAVHPARKKPELLATGPDQVWSWDIERHEAPRCRAEVRDLRRRAVAAAR
jgi:putative transposase